MFRLSIFCSVLCLPAVIATAQEVPAQSSEKSVAQATGPTRELPGESLELIPEVPKSSAKPKARKAEPRKKSSTEQESDDLQARIRYREARTRALESPGLREEWDRAQAAKTEPERREALKSYYKLLCDRMVKIDPSVKPRVEAFQKTVAWRLDPGARLRTKLAQPVEERTEEETTTQIR